MADPRGNVVNYPSNPHFRPRAMVKKDDTSADMEQRCLMLTNRALVVTEERSLGVQSRDEVKEICRCNFDTGTI
jgi:hypothetical protein